MTLRVTPEEIVTRSESPLLAIAPWWERCQLSHIAAITNGGAFKSRLFNSDGKGLPLIRIRDVGKAETRTYYSGDYEEKFIINPGDLLIGMDGDFRISRWQGTQALLNQRVCKLEVIDRTLYNDSFLEYVVQPYLDEVNKFTSAVTVKHLSSRTVAELPIPLPSLAEQTRIVDVIEEHFSRIDAAESAAQTALVRLDTLRRAILTAAFSGHLVEHLNPRRTSDGLPEDWHISTIGDTFKIVGGSTPRTDNPEYWDGEIPWLTPDDLSRHDGILVSNGRRFITEKGFQSTSTHMLPKDSILFSSRAPIGYIAIAANPLCTNQGFKSLIPAKGILPRYTYWFLRNSTPTIQDMGSGTTFKEISKKRLAVVPFSFPPIEHQYQIVTAIEEQFSRIDAATASLKRCLQRCAVLRRSILAAAFSGQLVEQDPSDEPASVLLERIAAEQPKRRTRRKSP